MGEIFSGSLISDAYKLKREAIARTLFNLTPEGIRINSIDELIKDKLDELTVEPAKIDEKAIRYTRKEVLVGDVHPMPGWELVWRLPFSGSPEAIDFQRPSQLPLKSRKSTCVNGAILLAYHTVDYTLVEASNLLHSDLCTIRSTLNSHAHTIAAENQALRQYAVQFIEARRAMWNLPKPDAALGYPGDTL